MDLLFLKLLNMGIAAGWLILALIALRPFLRKAPRFISCALWGLVAVRLLCPVSLESPFSLIPSAETISPKILTFADGALETPETSPDTTIPAPEKPGTPDSISDHPDPLFHSGIPALNSTLDPALRQSLQTESGDRSAPPHTWLSLAGFVWLLGLFCVLSPALLRYLKIRKKLREAVPFHDNIFLCDAIPSPFILGIARPRIYLSSGIGNTEVSYVLAHEQAHLERRDHWWKLLGFLLLAVYWFHPLCWAAYLLFCRDMELACDEKVIRHMNPEDKKAYSRALVSLSISGRPVLSCPPAFGEIGIKERVKAVLHYKKPAFWSIPVACAACLVIALCFLTNPQKAASSLQGAVPQAATSEAVSFHGRWYKRADLSEDTVEWLLWYNSLSEMEQYAVNSIPGDLWELDLKYRENAEVATTDAEHAADDSTAKNLDDAITNAIFEGNADSESVAVSFFRDDSGYHLTEYWIPREGGYFAEDIRNKFPEAIVSDAIDSQKFGILQYQHCYDQAVREGNLDTDSIVEGLLKTLSSEPSASSNPRDYLTAHAREYHELLYYGEYTLRYCFARFQKGGETGLEGKLMALICEELLQNKEENPSDAATAATGQEWYDALQQP